MKRYLASSFLLFLVGLLCLAQQPSNAFWQSRDSNYNKSVGGAAYAGPGDVVASATMWWGLRAYNSATRGNAAINVCLALDVTCGDFSTNSSTGALTITTIGGSSCAIVTCTVKKIYDQTAGGNCTGSCDIIQNTEANRPTFIVSCLSGLPCVRAAGSTSVLLATAGFASLGQPLTIAAVGLENGSTNFGYIVGTPFNNTLVGFGGGIAANTVVQQCASFQTATSTDGATQAIQAVCNGNAGGSNLYVNGSSTATTPGALGLDQLVNLLSNGGSALKGNWHETGAWGIAFSAGNQSAMNSNQRTYWGF